MSHDNLNKHERWTNYLLLLLFVAGAFYCAYKATNGLFLPADDDAFRDMAIAENIQHGFIWIDPSYLQEKLWYNPGLPAIEAFFSRITNIPLNVLIAQGGKYFNLLIPLTLFILCTKLFNKRVAFAAVTACIFFIAANDYGSHMSGYTYILLPICFTQSVFYLVLIMAYRVFNSKRNTAFLLLGAATGLLFLFHSAPSFIFCLILGFLLLHALVKKEMTFKAVLIKGLLFSTGLMVTASPLLYNIFIHYRFQVKNVDPTQWVYFLFRPGNSSQLFEENVNIYLLIALTGLVCLTRQKHINPLAKRIIIYWFCIAATIFMYLYGIVIIRSTYGIYLPGFVPSVDIFFYLKACESVLFGIGMVAIVEWIIAKIRPVKFNPWYLLYVLVSILVFLRLPAYYTRKEFGRIRMLTQEKQNNVSNYHIYNWLKANTGINDVVLCSLNEAQYPVMASGRKLVVTGIYYSNPYVDYVKRKEDDDMFLHELRQPHPEIKRFDAYHASYFILKKEEQNKYRFAQAIFPDLVYDDGMYLIRKK